MNYFISLNFPWNIHDTKETVAAPIAMPARTSVGKWTPRYTRDEQISKIATAQSEYSTAL